MWPWTASTQGFVYLFHFNAPLGNLANPRAQASHYVGFAEDLDARIAKHLAGKGAKIVAAALSKGLIFELYHWPACLATEKLVKKTKKTALYCPACCAASHRTPRPLPSPSTQLTLPLDFDNNVEAWPADFEFPEQPKLKMDWYEISHLQRWRAASAQPAVDPQALDDLL